MGREGVEWEEEEAKNEEESEVKGKKHLKKVD